MDFRQDSRCTTNQTIMMSPNNNNSNLIEVNVPLHNGLAAMLRTYGEEVVRALADHYKFDAEAAIRTFVKEAKVAKAPRVAKAKKEKKEKKPKAEKPPVSAIPLPWTGEKREGFCCGLRLNHGLHTQCTMVAASTGDYCKTCQKQADSSATGKPTYGCVEDRKAVGLDEYRDPKGKQSTPYPVVMKRLNISREDADAEATKLGLTIPEECFAERELTRGRPKKSASASDTDSSDSAQKVKKPRGRPKKAAASVVPSNGDDLISALVAKANSATPAAPPAPASSPTELTIQVHESPPAESPPAVLPLPQLSGGGGGAAAPAAPASPPTEADAAAAAKRAKAAEKRKRQRETKKAKAAEDAKAAEEKKKKEEEEAAAAAAAAAAAPAGGVEVVSKRTIGGKVYYEQKSSPGWLFDMNTKEIIGFYNEATGQIEDVDDEDEESEETED